ncbi:hypothetical protein [Spirosoma oryzicola]|uniref:hypothetical protein n=1 Tax=Spirosoma oryzicola TaxID=2898794 RepID=UPI001E60E18B|nr:hypothetical protein [Spirosoma oryzicola]UHG94632.1 hypothetical protein LQ777_28180 [Spirosoma oryzicola]
MKTAFPVSGDQVKLPTKLLIGSGLLEKALYGRLIGLLNGISRSGRGQKDKRNRSLAQSVIVVEPSP